MSRGMIKLLRVVGHQADGLDRLSRARLRRERLCVGCEENDGEHLVPVLGWVCAYCYEVLDLVFEQAIAETHEARRKVEAFVADLEGR